MHVGRLRPERKAYLGSSRPQSRHSEPLLKHNSHGVKRSRWSLKKRVVSRERESGWQYLKDITHVPGGGDHIRQTFEVTGINSSLGCMASVSYYIFHKWDQQSGGPPGCTAYFFWTFFFYWIDVWCIWEMYLWGSNETDVAGGQRDAWDRRPGSNVMYGILLLRSDERNACLRKYGDVKHPCLWHDCHICHGNFQAIMSCFGRILMVGML